MATKTKTTTKKAAASKAAKPAAKTKESMTCTAMTVPSASETVETSRDSCRGGGSSLLAPDRPSGRAFLMERDPPYCDVIVQRRTNHTSFTPKR